VALHQSFRPWPTPGTRKHELLQILATAKNPISTRDLSDATGMQPGNALAELKALERRGWVRLARRVDRAAMWEATDAGRRTIERQHQRD